MRYVGATLASPINAVAVWRDALISIYDLRFQIYELFMASDADPGSAELQLGNKMPSPFSPKGIFILAQGWAKPYPG